MVVLSLHTHCALLLALLTVHTAGAPTPPVVIIPGDGSNQLEAKWNKPSSPHHYCHKQSDWRRLWLNTNDLLFWTTCWADNIRVQVDPVTGRGENAPGVETRVPGFGDTSGIEELDPSVPLHKTAAFRGLVSALEKAGLQKNFTLRSAPYDFRFTPDRLEELDGFEHRLRELIEETYENAGQQRVALISHSMGGLHALYFLQQQSDSWKQRYIAKFVPVSAPWLGAPKIFRLMGSGDNEGLPVNTGNIMAEQRSYETNHWLSPAAHGYRAWQTQVFAIAGDVNYTAADWDMFLSDAGYSVGTPVMRRVRSLIRVDENGIPEAPGGVDVYCILSGGVDTPMHFAWASKKALGDGKSPKATMGDGDGTVATKSLRVCEAWTSDSASSAVTVTHLDNIEHSKMIMDAGAIRAIMTALGASVDVSVSAKTSSSVVYI